VLQNVIVDQHNWLRIKNERELSRMVESGALVSLPATQALAISPALPMNRRYVLPHVEVFLRELSQDFYTVFGAPLVVDSAVRPVTVQRRLRRVNRSAAPINGETASSHEAGCTIDIARHRLSRTQMHWLEFRLAYYQYARRIVLVEEERNCFHIMATEVEWNYQG